MDIVSETRAREASTPSLLNAAVHRHRAVSLAGFNERLFTLAFSGLVYPQIWEDPEVDAEAMELEPGHHVVAIASGGCNILSYLAAAPVRVTAVDLNMNHVALLRLKLAAYLAALLCHTRHRLRRLRTLSATAREWCFASRRKQLAPRHLRPRSRPWARPSCTRTTMRWCWQGKVPSA